jgi:hypothetical protein
VTIVTKYFKSKVNGVVIDDTSNGPSHAWSADRIIEEISKSVQEGVGSIDLELSALEDVSVPASPTDGYVLTYDSASGKWQAKMIDLRTSFVELSDVDVTDIKAGQMVRYNADTKKFVSFDLKMQDVTDFDGIDLDNGYIIRYDSETSKFKTVPMPEFKTELMGLTDVDTSILLDGMSLVWSESAQKFVFETIDAKTSLIELEDVDASNLSNGSIVRYSALSGKFQIVRPSLADMAEIDLSNVQEGQTLVYDADQKKFVPRTLATGGGEGSEITNNYTYNFNSTNQVTKLGVIASQESPATIDISIPHTKDFNLGKVEVLKAIEMPTETLNVAHFDSSDSTNFTYDEQFVEFDGTMRLKNQVVSPIGEGTPLGDGMVYRTKIDLSKWKRIDSISFE